MIAHTRSGVGVDDNGEAMRVGSFTMFCRVHT